MTDAPKPKKPPSAIERRMYALAWEALKEKVHEVVTGKPLVFIDLVVGSLDAIVVKAVPWPAPVIKGMTGTVSLARALELYPAAPVAAPAKPVVRK